MVGVFLAVAHAVVVGVGHQRVGVAVQTLEAVAQAVAVEVVLGPVEAAGVGTGGDGQCSDQRADDEPGAEDGRAACSLGHSENPFLG